MKKLLMAMAAAAMLLSCEKEETLTAKVNEPKDSVQAKTITFTFGEIKQQPMTRGTLQDASITDLWLFDYIGDELKQTVHQSSTDDGFGSVEFLSLDEVIASSDVISLHCPLTESTTGLVNMDFIRKQAKRRSIECVMLYVMEQYNTIYEFTI